MAASLQLPVATKQSTAALEPSKAAMTQAQQLPQQLPGAKEAASQLPAAGEMPFHLACNNRTRESCWQIAFRSLSFSLKILALSVCCDAMILLYMCSWKG